MKDKLEGGETVYPPKPKGEAKKRKTNSKEKPRRKRLRRSVSSEPEDTEGSHFDDEIPEDEEDREDLSQIESALQTPLTNDQVVVKLNELKSSKREARSQKLELADKIKVLRKEMDDAKSTEEKIDSKISAMCIAGRNQYSKGAIQQDFATGIKELDQELAAEEDEENFNPDVEARDYEEVARGLPVFCVCFPRLFHLMEPGVLDALAAYLGTLGSIVLERAMLTCVRFLLELIRNCRAAFAKTQISQASRRLKRLRFLSFKPIVRSLQRPAGQQTVGHLSIS